MFTFNGIYYYNDKGKKIIPTREEIREFYKLDDKVQVCAEQFPCEGYYICLNRSLKTYSYKTIEEARKQKEDMINSYIDDYLSKIQ